MGPRGTARVISPWSWPWCPGLTESSIPGPHWDPSNSSAFWLGKFSTGNELQGIAPLPLGFWSVVPVPGGCLKKVGRLAAWAKVWSFETLPTRWSPETWMESFSYWLVPFCGTFISDKGPPTKHLPVHPVQWHVLMIIVGTLFGAPPMCQSTG